jgi:transposase
MNYKAFIGIDVSKKTLDTALIEEDKEHYQQFTNDQQGFKKLLNWVKKITKTKETEMLFCMEHMGLYVLHISCFLSEQNIRYCLENPLQIKRSMGIKRIKNDKADAKMIANYIYLHHRSVKLYTLPSKTLLKLKILLAHRERLMRAKMLFANTIGELSDYTEKEINALVMKDSKSVQATIDKKIKLLEAEIEKLIKSDEELKKNYQLAKSVPGIGNNTAAYMLVFTHNFRSFDNWRQFACYSGVAPFEHTSGTSIKGKTKISPLANKKMKSLLSMGTMAALQSDPELKNYYQRKVAEGKHKMSVQNSIRNKLIGRVFAAVKRGTPYVSTMNFGWKGAQSPPL